MGVECHWSSPETPLGTSPADMSSCWRRWSGSGCRSRSRCTCRSGCCCRSGWSLRFQWPVRQSGILCVTAFKIETDRQMGQAVRLSVKTPSGCGANGSDFSFCHLCYGGAASIWEQQSWTREKQSSAFLAWSQICTLIPLSCFNLAQRARLAQHRG